MLAGLMIAVIGVIIMVYFDKFFLALTGVAIAIVGLFLSFILSDYCNVYTVLIDDYSDIPAIQQEYEITKMDGPVLTLIDKESD